MSKIFSGSGLSFIIRLYIQSTCDKECSHANIPGSSLLSCWVIKKKVMLCNPVDWMIKDIRLFTLFFTKERAQPFVTWMCLSFNFHNHSSFTWKKNIPYILQLQNIPLYCFILQTFKCYIIFMFVAQTKVLQHFVIIIYLWFGSLAHKKNSLLPHCKIKYTTTIAIYLPLKESTGQF